MIIDNRYLNPKATNKDERAHIKNKIYVYSPKGLTQLKPK